MKFLYKKYPAKKGQCIEVELGAPSMVKFMTAIEFRKYTSGRTHTYFKGRAEDNLTRIQLPFDSVWHTVVEKQDPEVTATIRLRMSCPELQPELPNYGGTDAEMAAELESLSRGGQSEG